jgi:hypothetical protein
MDQNEIFDDQKGAVKTLSEETIRLLVWFGRRSKWVEPRGYLNRTHRRISHGRWIPEEAAEGIPSESVCLISDPRKAHRTKTWCMKVLPLHTALHDATVVMRILSREELANYEDRREMLEEIRRRGLWDEIEPVITALRLSL